MTAKKLPFIIVSSIILIFDIALTFILNEYSVRPEGNDNTIYIIAKCIAVLLFVAVCIAGLLKKDTANYAIVYVATVVLQLLPLAIRYLSLADSGFVISVILFFVAIILYSALTAGLILLNKKTLKAEKQLTGKKIHVKCEDTEENDKNNTEIL